MQTVTLTVPSIATHLPVCSVHSPSPSQALEQGEDERTLHCPFGEQSTARLLYTKPSEEMRFLRAPGALRGKR